jgi:hypothetical protein
VINFDDDASSTQPMGLSLPRPEVERPEVNESQFVRLHGTSQSRLMPAATESVGDMADNDQQQLK